MCITSKYPLIKTIIILSEFIVTYCQQTWRPFAKSSVKGDILSNPTPFQALKYAGCCTERNRKIDVSTKHIW